MPSLKRCQERLLQLRQLCPIDEENEVELAASVQLCLLRFDLKNAREEELKLRQAARDDECQSSCSTEEDGDSEDLASRTDKDQVVPIPHSPQCSSVSEESVSEALQLVLDLVKSIPPKHPLIDDLDKQLGIGRQSKKKIKPTPPPPPLPRRRSSPLNILTSECDLSPNDDVASTTTSVTTNQRKFLAVPTFRQRPIFSPSNSSADKACVEICFDLGDFGSGIKLEVPSNCTDASSHPLPKKHLLTEDNKLHGDEYLLKRDIRARWYNAAPPVLDAAGRPMLWLHPYNTSIIKAASRVVRNTFWMHTAREERYQLRQREREIQNRQREIESALIIQNLFRAFAARKVVANRRVVVFEEFNSEMNELLAGLDDDYD
eukprot:TRINITY_DN24969_c0_g1_i1.p1 TRINITY_DN24969_c0_g1~~TRINITY_DN24969_c0_g1_i1.p1  ORF type:complete len:375 (+),score=67.88 TRINITY_DN24969_c0_g1_i1:70-1194(+)